MSSAVPGFVFFFVDFGGPVIPSEIRLLENLALTPSKQ
jgi:hypothetical protein